MSASTPIITKKQPKGRPKQKKPAVTRPRPRQKIMSEMYAEAKKAGLLPHEWLLKVSRGEPIPHMQWHIKYDKKGEEISRELVEIAVYADFATRIDAAKAAAPFFAPKLAPQPVGQGTPTSAVEMLRAVADKLPV